MPLRYFSPGLISNLPDTDYCEAFKCYSDQKKIKFCFICLAPRRIRLNIFSYDCFELSAFLVACLSLCVLEWTPFSAGHIMSYPSVSPCIPPLAAPGECLPEKENGRGELWEPGKLARLYDCTGWRRWVCWEVRCWGLESEWTERRRWQAAQEDGCWGPETGCEPRVQGCALKEASWGMRWGGEAGEGS